MAEEDFETMTGADGTIYRRPKYRVPASPAPAAPPASAPPPQKKLVRWGNALYGGTREE
jgi:hypothetical protein